MPDQDEPQVARGFLGLRGESLSHPFQIGRLIRRGQTDGNVICASIAAGLLPEAGPPLEILSVLLVPGRTDDEEDCGFVVPVGGARGESGRGEPRGQQEGK